MKHRYKNKYSSETSKWPIIEIKEPFQSIKELAICELAKGNYHYDPDTNVYNVVVKPQYDFKNIVVTVTYDKGKPSD